MSRFPIRWSCAEQQWLVCDSTVEAGDCVVAQFKTLLEAETYVIERSKRVEK